MRLLFINRLTGQECIGRMPLGILYLSSVLKRAGHQVYIADLCRPKEVWKSVAACRPDILLYSVRTGYHRFELRMNEALKAAFPDLTSVFGGTHATLYPAMIQEPHVDAICLGEAEEALCDFVSRLQEGGDFLHTPNFWIRKDGVLFRNPARPLIRDIDSIEYPDRELLNGHSGVRDFPIRSFLASRGCPYACAYCFNEAYFEIYEGSGQRFRLRAVDNLIREVKEERARRPFQAIQFEDDVFGMSHRWLEEFSKKFRGEVDLPFTCNVRVELVTASMAQCLKEAGCSTVWLGIETGDERVRRELLGRENSDEVTRRGVAYLREAGLQVAENVMIGIPQTTLEHDFQTLRLNRDLKPAYVNCHIFQPYPRTELARRAQALGLFWGDLDQIGDFNDHTALDIPHRRELANLQRLFALLNLFPSLEPCARWLIRLPFHSFYTLLYLVLKNIMTLRLYRVRPRWQHVRYLPLLFPEFARTRRETRYSQ